MIAKSLTNTLQYIFLLIKIVKFQVKKWFQKNITSIKQILSYNSETSIRNRLIKYKGLINHLLINVLRITIKVKLNIYPKFVEKHKVKDLYSNQHQSNIINSLFKKQLVKFTECNFLLLDDDYKMNFFDLIMLSQFNWYLFIVLLDIEKWNNHIKLTFCKRILFYILYNINLLVRIKRENKILV